MKRVSAAVALCLAAAAAPAQSLLPAAFVANNGNIRGSVTSFTIAPDGAVTRVQELVLGTSSSDPGVNCYAIAISPSGEYLMVSHATASSINERLSLLRVHPDATISLAANFLTPDSPLDLKWVRDDVVAVTRTRSSGTNEVRLYRFDESTLSLTLLDAEPAGAFASSLALSPDARVLLCNDSPLSGGGQFRSFLVDADAGTLTPAGLTPSATGYALGLTFSVDGRFAYCGSGSATTQGYVGAILVDAPTGSIMTHPDGPFPDFGASPKQVVASPDGRFLYTAHGSDSTIRLHALDAESGAPTDIGLLFDVGIQGSMGNMATLRIPGGPDLLLFTDRETYDSTPRGLCSAVIQPDGSLVIASLRVDTLGVAPQAIAPWPGLSNTCDADVNCDFALDGFDVEAQEKAVGGDTTDYCQPDPDFNHDLALDGFDVEAVELAVGGGPCP